MRRPVCLEQSEPAVEDGTEEGGERSQGGPLALTPRMESGVSLIGSHFEGMKGHPV